MAENIMMTIMSILMDSPRSLAAGMVIGFIFAKILNRRRGMGGMGGGF